MVDTKGREFHLFSRAELITMFRKVGFTLLQSDEESADGSQWVYLLAEKPRGRFSATTRDSFVVPIRYSQKIMDDLSGVSQRWLNIQRSWPVSFRCWLEDHWVFWTLRPREFFHTLRMNKQRTLSVPHESKILGEFA